MMRRALITLSLTLLALASSAQKFAYVDSEFILNRIPTYRSAQEQLDRLAAQYQKEVEDGFARVEQQYRSFQAEKVLLTEDMKNRREEAIIAAEREVQELQRRYFGRDGLLFKKREELVKPIQDLVFNAIKEIATEGGYAVIFDTAASPNMLYTNPRYDQSDEVLQKLGYN